MKKEMIQLDFSRNWDGNKETFFSIMLTAFDKKKPLRRLKKRCCAATVQQREIDCTYRRRVKYKTIV